MSNNNNESNKNSERVNMQNAPRRHTYGPVQHQIPNVSRAGYMDYQKSGRGTPKLSTKSDFVYVNTAYVGSVSSLNNNVSQQTLPEPPTSVIREQYWACSRWPLAQRVLAIAVGVLLGAVVGLVLILFFKGDSEENISGLFRTPLAPD
ncbi:uncharacterized protein LOC116779334 [Danaus plexippus]|uniref:uncharacterized protein LOC116779334 n=1 Tax=Danaus plexippus TaxID=13037 RepID=UPI002AB11F49|nr:uncharacterized protein LOC116779334 [Danaus plexippus]